MSKKGSLFGKLQQIGKALMLPVAILPAAGMLLAFGNMFQNPAFLSHAAFLNAIMLSKLLLKLWSNQGILYLVILHYYLQ